MLLHYGDGPNGWAVAGNDDAINARALTWAKHRFSERVTRGSLRLTPAMAGLRQAAFLFAHATPHPVDLMCPQRKRQAFTPDPAPCANSLRLRLLRHGLAGR